MTKVTILYNEEKGAAIKIIYDYQLNFITIKNI